MNCGVVDRSTKNMFRVFEGRGHDHDEKLAEKPDEHSVRKLRKSVLKRKHILIIGAS